MSESKFMTDQHWHLDKKVNLSIIVALVIYAGIAIWQFASLTSAVAENAQAIVNVEARLNERIDRQNARQDAALTEIKELLKRIEDKLDDKADK